MINILSASRMRDLANAERAAAKATNLPLVRERCERAAETWDKIAGQHEALERSRARGRAAQAFIAGDGTGSLE